MQKAIFITGSSSGLGLEIAKQLLLKKHTIIINGRDEKKLKKIKKSLEYKDNIFVFPCDFLKKNSIKELDDFLNQNKLDVTTVIHNIGGKVENDNHPILEEVLDDSLNVNLKIAIKINNLLIPKMAIKKEGKIIHIGSVAGLDANASPSYAISKAALHAYVKNLARFCARDNILINAVVPGIFLHENSDWNKKQISNPQKFEQKRESLPLNEFASVEDIAEHIVLLCSLKSIQSTGSLIVLNGGV